jgi:hypothetical protein
MKWPGRISLTLATVATLFGVAGNTRRRAGSHRRGGHPALQPRSTKSNFRDRPPQIRRDQGRRERFHALVAAGNRAT